MSHNLHRREGEGKKTLTKQISLKMNKRLGEGAGGTGTAQSCSLP